MSLSRDLNVLGVATTLKLVFQTSAHSCHSKTSFAMACADETTDLHKNVQSIITNGLNKFNTEVFSFPDVYSIPIDVHSPLLASAAGVAVPRKLKYSMAVADKFLKSFSTPKGGEIDCYLVPHIYSAFMLNPDNVSLDHNSAYKVLIFGRAIAASIGKYLSSAYSADEYRPYLYLPPVSLTQEKPTVPDIVLCESCLIAQDTDDELADSTSDYCECYQVPKYELWPESLRDEPYYVCHRQHDYELDTRETLDLEKYMQVFVDNIGYYI